MEKPSWHNIHPDFTLNGAHYSLEDLSEIGYSLVKEGESFEVSMGDFLLDWVSDKSTLEVQTSGSTGIPKKITLKKEHMVNSALATGAYFVLKPKDSALLCLPCTGIAGKMMLVRAMVLGLHLDYVEPSSTPLSQNNKQYGFAAMVPLQVQKSLKNLLRVKTLIIGGAPVGQDLVEKLGKAQTAIYETYGMTETITHIAVKEINPVSKPNFEVLPNVTVSMDSRGCLVIDAPRVSDTRIVTNDMVELTADNQFIWLGRYDSIINSGGIKLFPEKIEKSLSELISSRFFVAGIHDETLGHKLILVIEGDSMDEDDLLQKIKMQEKLSKYEVPKAIYFVKTFVETPTHKIDRLKTLQLIS
jgi:O-succinylbenzoic acid--CoA ligase